MTPATPPLRIMTQVSSSNQSSLQEIVTHHPVQHTHAMYTRAHTHAHTHSSTPSVDAFALWMEPASSAWCCLTAAFSDSHRPVITCDPVAHHKPAPPTLQKSLSVQLMASHCSTCQLSSVCPARFVHCLLTPQCARGRFFITQPQPQQLPMHRVRLVVT